MPVTTARKAGSGPIPTAIGNFSSFASIVSHAFFYSWLALYLILNQAPSRAAGQNNRRTVLLSLKILMLATGLNTVAIPAIWWSVPLFGRASLPDFTANIRPFASVRTPASHYSACRSFISLNADVQCGFPARIPNGSYKLINETRHYLSMVSYSCNEGYQLIGRGDLICDVDGRWNGPPPRCERKQFK